MKNILSKFKITPKIFYLITAGLILVAVSVYFYSVHIDQLAIYLPNKNPSLQLIINKAEITHVQDLMHEGIMVGTMSVKYISEKYAIFSELYITSKIGGKDIVLYKITKDGFYRFGEKDVSFNEEEFGGIRGYQLIFIGNDFFVVQLLGFDNSKNSDLIVVYWDAEQKIYRTTTKVPKTVLDIIGGTRTY